MKTQTYHKSLYEKMLPPSMTRNSVVMGSLKRFEIERKRQRQPLTAISVIMICRHISEWTPAQVVAAVEKAVTRGWSTLYKT